jgi:hypothetical protein
VTISVSLSDERGEAAVLRSHSSKSATCTFGCPPLAGRLRFADTEQVNRTYDSTLSKLPKRDDSSSVHIPTRAGASSITCALHVATGYTHLKSKDQKSAVSWSGRSFPSLCCSTLGMLKALNGDSPAIETKIGRQIFPCLFNPIAHIFRWTVNQCVASCGATSSLVPCLSKIPSVVAQVWQCVQGGVVVSCSDRHGVVRDYTRVKVSLVS